MACRRSRITGLACLLALAAPTFAEARTCAVDLDEITALLHDQKGLDLKAIRRKILDELADGQVSVDNNDLRDSPAVKDLIASVLVEVPKIVEKCEQ